MKLRGGKNGGRSLHEEPSHMACLKVALLPSEKCQINCGPRNPCPRVHQNSDTSPTHTHFCPTCFHPFCQDHSPGTRLLSATGLGRAHGGTASWPLAGYLGKPWLAWPCGCRWRGAVGIAPPGSAAPASHSSGCRHPTLLSPTWRQTGQRQREVGP